MSDLRERIAAVLYTRFTHALPWDGVDQEPWLDDADAVIAELGLETEWAVEIDYAANLTESYPTEAEARERAAEINEDDPETWTRVVCRIESDWRSVDE